MDLGSAGTSHTLLATSRVVSLLPGTRYAVAPGSTDARVVLSAHPTENVGVQSSESQLLQDLEWMQRDFDDLVRSAASADLDRHTDATRWTNRELLFHMWFGQRIARVVVPLIGLTSRLPLWLTRAYAKVLTRATRPYEWINYVGAVVGVRVVGLDRARRWMAADTAWLLTWAQNASPAELARGMDVPETWDPYFASWMNRRDVLEWSPQHYRHHRAQLVMPVPTQHLP